MKWIKIEDLLAEVTEEQLSGETFTIDFGGNYMIGFLKHKGNWIVLNAMNGWGNNCLHEFEKSKVLILTDESPTPKQEHKEQTEAGESEAEAVLEEVSLTHSISTGNHLSKHWSICEPESYRLVIDAMIKFKHTK